RVSFDVVEELAVERFEGRPAPIPGHPVSLASFCWHLPHLVLTASIRCKVDPLAISRPAWGGVVCGIRGQANWLSSTCSDDIDIEVPLMIRIEGDPLPIRRPVRGPGADADACSGEQFHGVGAICVADPDGMVSTALGFKGDPLAVRGVFCRTLKARGGDEPN